MLSNPATFDDNLHAHWSQPGSVIKPPQANLASSHQLPVFITKAASRQTYYTIRWLVDRGRTADAYRAYAYFRWLDDTLDEGPSDSAKGIAFVERQRALIEGAYQGRWPHDVAPEEQMLLDLIRGDNENDSGLQAYIRNMMAVIAFDAQRRGRLISQQELNDYTRHLAIAVTEVLHYFIGHDQFAPRDDTRYCAVTGAHIAHMLRDTHEDIAAGYYNIPREFLDAHGIAPWDVESPAYREWVRSRVQLARAYLRAAKAHLARVENPRARIAGYAYLARFENVLEAIEHDSYQLRSRQREGKGLQAGLRIGWSMLTFILRDKLTRPRLPTSAEPWQPSTIQLGR